MNHCSFRTAAVASACLLLSLELGAQRIVCDETCRLAASLMKELGYPPLREFFVRR